MKRYSSAQVDTGHLQVTVTYPNASRPIDAATVEIFTNSNGNSTQIEEFQTDQSGRCPLIDLPAPPIDYSMSPNQPMPYATYDIQIKAQGYEPQLIKGVQVLPEATALSNIALQQEGIRAQQVEQIALIPPHTLYKEYPPKIPEADVKPLPPPTGFVVLDRVVVPETIVVHDGRPDAEAPRFYPAFKDYIKNVASSEIYATWPRESLKSNVLAIISFTLNRVFTVIRC